MKELSIEEKARYYDRALAKAKEEAIDGYLDAVAVRDIFPELKESKDEQSKNWILEYLYDGLRKSDEQFKDQFKAAIAWFEKQEWSENDEYNKRQVCRILRDAGCSQKLQDKINSWLESFRFQPHWKPSDEQIMALRWVLNHIPYDSHKEEISGLLEQLKKLREE